MKNKTSALMLLMVSYLLAACTKQDKVPASPSSIADIQQFISGKTWKVVDLGIVTATVSAEAQVVENTSKIVRPAAVRWLGEEKELGAFEKDILEQEKLVTMQFNADSAAILKGMKLSGKQQYYLTDKKEEDNLEGIKLKISGETEMFGSQSTITYTYFILGASEDKLYVLSPRDINRKQVVVLLEAKE